jgi:uncharacterized Tic20 family protein
MSEFPERSPIPTLPVSDDERLWAMLAHLFGLIGYSVGIGQYIGPLVVYFMYKDRSRFVAFHALQSLYFQLLLLVASSIVVALAFVTCGVLAPLAMVIPVGGLIYVIVAAIRAHDGQLFEYWLVGKWARNQMGL